MNLPIQRATNDVWAALEPLGFHRLLNEAVEALQAADLAAEMLARVGITESNTYDRLVDLISEALKAIYNLQDLPDAKPSVIFPNVGVARAWIERGACDTISPGIYRHPSDENVCYLLCPDGVGRTTIAIALVVQKV